MNRPELLHTLLQHLTECLTVYVCHQIDCGAQASMTVHVLVECLQGPLLSSIRQATCCARPVARQLPSSCQATLLAGGTAIRFLGAPSIAGTVCRVQLAVRGANHQGRPRQASGHPTDLPRQWRCRCDPPSCKRVSDTQLSFRSLHLHMGCPASCHPHVSRHGILAGSGKMEEMASCSADVIGLDWSVDIGRARATLGAGRVVQGNVDPMVLFGSEAVITAEVQRVLSAAGPTGHILNVGHGVAQGTPEESVALFCDLARRSDSPARELVAV